MAQDVQPSPVDRLKSEAVGLLGALGNRALSSAGDRVKGTVGRLTNYVDGGGGPGLAAAVTGAKDRAEGKGPARSLLGAGGAAVKQAAGGLLGKGGDGKGGGGGDGKGKNLKVTNIVESIDVGAPIRLVYNQWTQFADFPSFMKKVESVGQAEEQTLNWKAQILWSHRSWEATIQKQVPDDKIIWRSKGSKGSVDGAVTFHEITPTLTRILLVLEYHPQGFFEGTGNLWRAQGRRARLELKHFRRHAMSELLLHPEDEVEGWRGVIEDGEVVKDHETAVREEEQGGGPDEDRAEDEDRADEDRAEDEDHEDEDREDEDHAEDEDREDEDHADEGREEDEDDAEDGGRDGGRRPAHARRDGGQRRRQTSDGQSARRTRSERGSGRRAAERPRRPARAGSKRGEDR
jgi:uncharacterized membrane protein